MAIPTQSTRSSPTVGATTSRYRKEIDSLRAISILLVLVSHWEPTWFASIDWGMIGVYVFFAISGYLITGILVDQKTKNKINIKNFYLNRALRIWPIYFLALAFIYFFCAQFDRSTTLWHVFFASNILFGARSEFLFPVHFWSLAVEQQFYLIWPFVALASKRNLKFACLALLLIGPIFRWYFYARVGNLQLSAFSLLSNVDFLAAGALLAIAERSRTGVNASALTTIGMTSIVAMVIILTSSGWLHESLIWLTGTAVAGISAWAIFWIGENHVAKAVMSNPVTCYIGRISYGIYIYHLMIGDYIWSKFGASLGPWEYMASSFLVTCLVASASWHLIEQPILSLKKGRR
jgi:peptidoglycan/LPS O-acetylase OafA/YrhL